MSWNLLTAITGGGLNEALHPAHGNLGPVLHHCPVRLPVQPLLAGWGDRLTPAVLLGFKLVPLPLALQESQVLNAFVGDMWPAARGTPKGKHGNISPCPSLLPAPSPGRVVAADSPSWGLRRRSREA